MYVSDEMHVSDSFQCPTGLPIRAVYDGRNIIFEPYYESSLYDSMDRKDSTIMETIDWCRKHRVENVPSVTEANRELDGLIKQLHIEDDEVHFH